jgi:hypothetical protein
MPGKNGTGPKGEGAMTGRRMGQCASKGAGIHKVAEVQSVKSVENVQTPEVKPMEPGMGKGPGRGGKGLGMGRRNRFRNGDK